MERDVRAELVRRLTEAGYPAKLDAFGNGKVKDQHGREIYYSIGDPFGALLYTQAGAEGLPLLRRINAIRQEVEEYIPAAREGKVMVNLPLEVEQLHTLLTYNGVALYMRRLVNSKIDFATANADLTDMRTFTRYPDAKKDFALRAGLVKPKRQSVNQAETNERQTGAEQNE